MGRPFISRKLPYLLSTLLPEERSAFRDYLLRKKFLVPAHMLEIMEKTIFQPEGAAYTSEAFYAAVLPNKTFNPDYLHPRMTELQDSFFDFIVGERNKTRPGIRYQILLKEFILRGWDKYFLALYGNAIKWWKTQEVEREISEELYRLRIEFEQQYITYRIRNTAKQPELLYQKMNDFHERFILLQRLKKFYSISNYDRELGSQHSLVGMEECLGFAEQLWDKLPPLIQAYYFRLKSFLEPQNTDLYQKGETLLFSIDTRLEKEDGKALYTGAINYCARKINQGQKEFSQHAEELYRRMFQLELMSDDAGKILYSDFLNAVTTFSKAGKFKLVTDFIQENQDQLSFPKEGRAAALNFCWGILYFYQKEYEACIRYMLKFPKDPLDFDRNPRSRTFICISIWELGKYDHYDLDRRLRNFKEFIKMNQGFSESSREMYRQFLDFFEQLYALVAKRIMDQKVKNEKLAALEKELKKLPETRLNLWLSEKIREQITA